MKNFCEDLFFFFFFGDRLTNFYEDLLFFFGDRLKNFCEDFFFFFFGEHSRLCPWSLALAWSVSVLGKAVLGLGFFLCPWPWPWPRALCPRLHLCALDIFYILTRKLSITLRKSYFVMCNIISSLVIVVMSSTINE